MQGYGREKWKEPKGEMEGSRRGRVKWNGKGELYGK